MGSECVKSLNSSLFGGGDGVKCWAVIHKELPGVGVVFVYVSMCVESHTDVQLNQIQA